MIGNFTFVYYLPNNLQFMSDSQDVQAVRDYLGDDIASEYDSFFIEILDGDYGKVYGMFGIVPYLSREVTRIR